MENNLNWMSILEYAAWKKTSISTIRRNIKSKKIETKKVDGKFFILVEGNIPTKLNDYSKEELKYKLEAERLKQLLNHQQEEINDLRMLVNIYEAEKKSIKELPELPFV